MARNEQIICDACKKVWDKIQGGQTMDWERQVDLSYLVEHGMGINDLANINAEVCDACAGKVSWALTQVKMFLEGDADALPLLSHSKPEGGSDEQSKDHAKSGHPLP